MQVKKTSWHYRLWMLGRASHSKPHNLCKYFWHIVLLKVTAPLIVALLALGGIISIIWVVVRNPLVSGLIVTGAALLVMVVVGLVFGIQKLRERSRRKRRERPEVLRFKEEEKKKEPSLVWQYLVARKKKLCPLITVVDEETS